VEDVRDYDGRVDACTLQQVMRMVAAATALGKHDPTYLLHISIERAPCCTLRMQECKNVLFRL
jgi:hypothetical protein